MKKPPIQAGMSRFVERTPAWTRVAVETMQEIGASRMAWVQSASLNGP